MTWQSWSAGQAGQTSGRHYGTSSLRGHQKKQRRALENECARPRRVRQQRAHRHCECGVSETCHRVEECILDALACSAFLLCPGASCHPSEWSVVAFTPRSLQRRCSNLSQIPVPVPDLLAGPPYLPATHRMKAAWDLWQGTSRHALFRIQSWSAILGSVPWWLLISTPPVVLAGAVLSVVFVSKRTDALSKDGLWGIIVFPVAATIARDSTLLRRHPTPRVHPARDCRSRHRRLGRSAQPIAPAPGPRSRRGDSDRWPCQPAGVPLAFPSEPARVPSNSVVGGPGRAVMRYDMDYWGNCVLQALQWSAELARDSQDPFGDLRESGASGSAQ